MSDGTPEMQPLNETKTHVPIKWMGEPNPGMPQAPEATIGNVAERLMDRSSLLVERTLQLQAVLIGPSPHAKANECVNGNILNVLETVEANLADAIERLDRVYSKV